MPIVTEKPTVGYAHCVNPHCSGTTQQEVDAVHVLTEMRFRDRDPNTPFPGVENSHEAIRFADSTERPCPACGGPRDITDQRRPVYQPLSAGLSGAPAGGFPQDGLLNVDEFEQGKDPRVDQLQEELAELKALIKAQAEGNGEGD